MKLVAHRGLQSKNSKENTLEAILLGAKNPYIEAVEIDVRLTKDKRVVVIHDDKIDRVSNGRGKVRDMSLERLKRFNFGSKIKPSTINTLEDVLERFDSSKELIIELKDEGKNNALLVSKVIDILDKYPDKNILLKSFNEEIINSLKEHDTYKVGALIDNYNTYMLKKNMDFYSISKDVLSYELLLHLLNNNKPVMVWGIKDKNDYKNLSDKLEGKTDVIYVISDILLTV